MSKQAQNTKVSAQALTATAIGFLVWHQLRDVPVEPTHLDKAMADAGFDPNEWSIKPRSRVQVFSESIKRLVGRTYQTLDGRSQETRCMFPLSLPDSDDGYRLRSIHVAKGDKGTKKNALAQIGVISFHLDSETVSWSFTGIEGVPAAMTERHAGETDKKYVKRFKVAIANASSCHITEADVDAFIQSVHDVSANVDKFGGKVDRRFMHFLIRDALYKRQMHAVALRPSGGIYFLPHNGKADSPAETFKRFARVIMDVCPADQIHMMPQYPDPETKSAIANSAQMSLSGRIQEIQDQLQDLESIDRISMVTSKTDTINSVLASAELYRDLVGMKADELDGQIATVRDRISELTADLDQKKAANAAARKTSRTSIKKQLKEAEAEREQLLARIAELEAAAAAKSPAADVIDCQPEPRFTPEQIDGIKATNKSASEVMKTALTDGNIRETCKLAKQTPCKEIHCGELVIDFNGGVYCWELLNDKAGQAKRVIDVVRQVKKAVAAQ